MWRKITPAEEKDFLEKAIAFTGNHVLYGSWMIRVIDKWPVSCEHNLTDFSQNRRAWIGHAAVCLAMKCPEYITRSAWGHLDKKQQDLANEQADVAIALWEKSMGIVGGSYAQALLDF